jgi:hypothetical protein
MLDTKTDWPTDRDNGDKYVPVMEQSSFDITIGISFAPQ